MHTDMSNLSVLVVLVVTIYPKDGEMRSRIQGQIQKSTATITEIQGRKYCILLW